MAITNSVQNRNEIIGLMQEGRATIGQTFTGTIKTSAGDMEVKYDHKRREDPSTIDRLSGKCFNHKLACIIEDKERHRSIEVSVKFGDGMIKDDLATFAMVSSFLNQVASKL